MFQDLILPGFDRAMVTIDEFKEALAPYTTSPVQYKERCHNMELARETAECWGWFTIITYFVIVYWKYFFNDIIMDKNLLLCCN